MSKTRNLLLAIAATGLLAVAGLATSVAAAPGDDRRADASDRSGPRHDDRLNRSAERQDRHESMRDAHDAWQACKRENATLNESMQDRCMGEKSFFLNATHAVREARAVHGAIAAMERTIGRLELRQLALEDQLADGNLSANETAEIQEKIDRIESVQERLADKLEALKDRLEARHERWAAVRQYVADHEDDESDGESDD